MAPVHWAGMSDSSTTTEMVVPPPSPAVTGGPGIEASDDGGTSATKRVALWVLVSLLIVGLALLIAFFGSLRHWLALHTGILNGGPDRYYNFWSGFGSDLGEATLISAVGIGVYTGARKVNCHTKGCWRIGHHVLEGTPYILCRRHHPGVPTGGATHEQILEQHRKFKQAKEAREAAQRLS
jgi:hypothetical protein